MRAVFFTGTNSFDLMNEKNKLRVVPLPIISFESTVFRAQSAVLNSGPKFTPLLDHETSSTE